MIPDEIHVMHVIDDGQTMGPNGRPLRTGHVHWNVNATTEQVQAIGKAARAFLNDDRTVPVKLKAGFYPIRLDDDRNLIISRRIADAEPA